MSVTGFPFHFMVFEKAGHFPFPLPLPWKEITGASRSYVVDSLAVRVKLGKDRWMVGRF